MIISHKHQFIFIHLGRTGGRSLTMALAKHCGQTDIITPTGDFLGQNVTGWHRHTAAKVVRDRLGPAIWDKYFTFTAIPGKKCSPTTGHIKAIAMGLEAGQSKYH